MSTQRLVTAVAQEIPEVLRTMGTSLDGLDEREARRRLKAVGPNVITSEAQPGVTKLVIRRIYNPLVLLLLFLATLSVFIGDTHAASMMLVMVFIGVGLGSYQESYANRAAAKLAALVHTSATVTRRSTHHRTPTQSEVPQSRLVPGDIVHLSAGDLVPADLRLLSSKDLSLDQAALTGESLPVDKHADRKSNNTDNMFEFPNACFMGSSVVSGSATAVAILTGKDTYFGGLAKHITGQRAVTSFEKGINQFTWLMIRFILVMVPLVFVINGFSKGNWFEALLFALSVGVGLTPEMLPMIVTVNLAKGAIDMSRKKVIVKRLNSIQNLGGMDVLCTDKTGTRV